MGEYVGIAIGNYVFVERKNAFLDLLSLFSPHELKIDACYDEDGEQYQRRYFSKTVYEAKKCLDVMGHTIGKAKELFESYIAGYIEYLEEEGNEEEIEKVIREYSFEMWEEAVIKYSAILAKDEHINGSFSLLEKERPITYTEKKVYDSLPYDRNDTYFGMDLYYSDKDAGNFWDVFRVVLEAFADEELLVLDYTNLYEGGWCNEYPEEEDYQVSKTIILTEGNTDTTVIRNALHLLFPYLEKYYSFVDYH